MKNIIPAFFASLIMLSLMSVSTSALAIKKCKDDQGNWHYGDIAVDQCSTAKVTTLNERGFIESELDVPKTAEEIQQEQDIIAKEQAEKLRLEELEKERNRVLSIYETEDDIDRQRDNQINSVQSNIDVHMAYIKSLDKRIARQETSLTEVKNKAIQERINQDIAGAKVRKAESIKNLEALKAQKTEIMERFEHEKKVYLDLKNQ